ncbi:MAG: phenylalanine--tRNA ligase subunit beta [Chloroflexi bacterium]|nr:phenylalanine--tRNA ligase subunit beta [Chloroflexota bacterium]
MRVPLGWLADYVDLDLTPEALAERLTVLGMEVRGIERWGAAWQDVVVGELLTVAKHPNADRLSLTTVLVGEDEPLSIVCGATNIAPGQRVPVALPGATLPGGRRIERTEKMGIVSNGMLCSGAELGMTADAEGILILGQDAPVGRPLADLYGDTVLDVDVKPNRGDALSLVGLAREVAAATGATVRFPSFTVEEVGAGVAERLIVEVREPDLCPRFVARYVGGVRIGPSPDAIQMRLQAAGMRPIDNVVDASNFVMLELGKPTHTFDAAHIEGGRLIVRRALDGERLATLDHVDRTLDPSTLVIADARRVLAIAGIIGGAESEVSDATRDVVVESAIFDPVAIRRTGHRYALRSEASLRFEKGQESRLARIGADRVAALVSSWAGGSVAPGRIDTTPVEPEEHRVRFRPARVDRLLGTRLGASTQATLLGRVGIATMAASGDRPVVVSSGTRPLEVAAHGEEVLEAIIPTWRHDLAVEADLAEEVARVAGYETIAEVLPDTAMPHHRPAPLGVRDAVRSILAGAGLREVVTYALIAPARGGAMSWPGDAGRAPDGEADAAGTPISATNPLSLDHSVLRQQLVGSLLEVVDTNLRQGRPDIAIFEVGKGYGRVDDAPHEWWRLAFALTGPSTPATWDRPPTTYDLADAKGVIETLAEALGLPPVDFTPWTDGYPFHPGRAAVANAGAGLVGRVGECHPSLLAALDLRADRIVVAELAIAGLTRGIVTSPRIRPVPRHPAVERDIAIVVPEDRPVADVAATIRAAAGTLLVDARLFDIYRGAPLGADDKSVAFRLTFQAERTLTEPEIDRAFAAIATGLVASGARLRT